MILAATGLDTFVHAVIKSLALGSLYALLALGFVLIFKATQTVNFAQGALALAGTWFLSLIFMDWNVPGRWVGGPGWLHWFVALLLAALATAGFGLVIERLAIRPMIGEPIFSMAVITLGLEVMIRTIAFDAVNVTPRVLGIPWGAETFMIGGAFIAWSYIAAIAMAAVAFAGVWLFFKTRTGVAMRATAFDQEAALAQGINVGRIFAIAWAAGALLAAVSGVFASMPPWGPAGMASRDGAFFAFRALPAVILGGLDSAVGALVGGLLIGFAEIFAGQYLAGHTEILGVGYQQVVPYVVMLIGLLVKPYGLFGTEEVRRV
ncbi:MAG: High-affinity branched-chain amino acid transport system permease protein LivH [Acidimicrobiaceae bacterium]|nr:High-affinity branched-chain amino acid transport system permease protein LivH [Acidimicrobiaceae bacterium]